MCMYSKNYSCNFFIQFIQHTVNILYTVLIPHNFLTKKNYIIKRTIRGKEIHHPTILTPISLLNCTRLTFHGIDGVSRHSRSHLLCPAGGSALQLLWGRDYNEGLPLIALKVAHLPLLSTSIHVGLEEKSIHKVKSSHIFT